MSRKRSKPQHKLLQHIKVKWPSSLYTTCTNIFGIKKKVKKQKLTKDQTQLYLKAKLSFFYVFFCVWCAKKNSKGRSKVTFCTNYMPIYFTKIISDQSQSCKRLQFTNKTKQCSIFLSKTQTCHFTIVCIMYITFLTLYCYAFVFLW